MLTPRISLCLKPNMLFSKLFNPKIDMVYNHEKEVVNVTREIEFFDADLHIGETGNEGNVILQVALEPVRNHSYADGQVLMSAGFDADIIEAETLEATTNGGLS